MFCNRCGQRNDETASACVRCGAALPQTGALEASSSGEAQLAKAASYEHERPAQVESYGWGAATTNDGLSALPTVSAQSPSGATADYPGQRALDGLPAAQPSEAALAQQPTQQPFGAQPYQQPFGAQPYQQPYAQPQPYPQTRLYGQQPQPYPQPQPYGQPPYQPPAPTPQTPPARRELPAGIKSALAWTRAQNRARWRWIAIAASAIAAATLLLPWYGFGSFLSELDFLDLLTSPLMRPPEWPIILVAAGTACACAYLDKPLFSLIASAVLGYFALSTLYTFLGTLGFVSPGVGAWIFIPAAIFTIAGSFICGGFEDLVALFAPAPAAPTPGPYPPSGTYGVY